MGISLTTLKIKPCTMVEFFFISTAKVNSQQRVRSHPRNQNQRPFQSEPFYLDISKIVIMYAYIAYMIISVFPF